MQAILLAGGFGTRLRSSIGELLPKPMIMVDDEPFLAHYIRSLAAQGVQEVILALHHQAYVIQNYFGAEFAHIPIRYSIEETPLGTGGAIKQALSLLRPEHEVFVSNADTWMDLDIQAMHQTHMNAHTMLTIATTHLPDCSHSGELAINEYGTVTGFVYPGGTHAGYVSMGAYIMVPNIFEPFELAKNFSFESDFKTPYLSTLKPAAYMHQGVFLDFGTEISFKRFQTEYKRLSA